MTPTAWAFCHRAATVFLVDLSILLAGSTAEREMWKHGLNESVEAHSAPPPPPITAQHEAMHHMHGEAFAEDYQFRSVPAFVILDETGQLVT